MDEGSVRLLFWHLVASQAGGLKIIFRGLDRLLPPTYKNVEYKVQQILRVIAVLERSNIIRL